MRQGSSEGFTLVETLVAFAILMLVAGATYPMLATVAARARSSAEQEEAARLLRSLLAQADCPAPRAGVSRSGRDGELVWRIDVTAGGTAADAAAWPVAACRIDVSLTTPRGRRIAAVQTLRLAARSDLP